MFHRLRGFRLSLLVLLGACLVALLAEPLAPLVLNSTVQHEFPFIQPQGMRGGAINTTRPTASSQSAACTHSDLASTLIQQEFGLSANALNPKYLHATLCDDAAQALTTTECLAASQLFPTIGWPVDLLHDMTQVVCTHPHQSGPGQAGHCFLNDALPNNPFWPVDYCQVFGTVLKGAADNFNASMQWVVTQSQTLTERIPEVATYNNPAVVTVWNAMIAIVDALVLIALLWIGLRYLLSGTNAVNYASIIEVLPRLFLTLLLVHFSLKLSQFVIDFNNALCDALVHHIGISPIPAAQLHNAPGFFVPFLGVLQSTLNVLLVVQAAVQIAGIAFAISLAPLCLFCLFHPDTQRIARTWITAFCALCLMRFLQVLAITVGGRMVSAGVLNSMSGGELLNLLIGIGVLVVAFLIPGILRQWMLMPTGGGVFSAIGQFVMMRAAAGTSRESEAD